jgi:L-cystine transport system substrate-binding protein
VEGRYDAYMVLQVSYNDTVVSDKGAWHSLADKLKWAPFKGINTWPMFNKDHQDLANKYDAAIQKLRADGTITKLSMQYFGEDVFKYLSN